MVRESKRVIVFDRIISIKVMVVVVRFTVVSVVRVINPNMISTTFVTLREQLTTELFYQGKHVYFVKKEQEKAAV